MQYHGIDKVRQYLLLVRLPNVFTAPSNVLVGYVTTVHLAQTNDFHVASLMISSSLLYVAGIVLNDYFDIDIDMVERPSRPLPSGGVSKEHAMGIALAAFLVANTIALTVSLASFAVSAALTAAIVAYDYRLKNGPTSPFAMGSTRLLNVILGVSPALFAISAIAISAAGLLFVYVVAIMILSRREVGDEKPNTAAAFSIVFAIIALIFIIGFLLQFQLAFLVNLAIFATVMLITFGRRHSIPQSIKNMVISIIIFDSIFVSGAAGLILGLATILFVVPTIFLAKKLYMT